MAGYNHTAIEKKWRENWEKNPINVNDGKKPKYYCLDMFPYPSGSGLHVGHWRGYVLSDVISRYKILQGYYVLHPMGWDAFGLPAENFAIKHNIHPAISTAENIANVKRQLHEISAVYDWDREVNTTDPSFYKWTQWIFVQMFKKGLAYEKEMPLNWCPSCKCVLANEEATNGVCERCGSQVTKKNLRQWMLKITAYADRLLDDLSQLEWPEKVKKMQTDWIGKSYGAEVEFPVKGRDEKITVYTTRPDTLHGATFMVLSPEHKLAKELATDETREAVEKYIFDASMKSNVDRLQGKEKTGVFTGSYAINPLNGKEVPIWLSDYVLSDYGTGAIMAVPAHDERDFAFAQVFGLPILQVVQPPSEDIDWRGFCGYEGASVNSGFLTGLPTPEAKEKMILWLEENGKGRRSDIDTYRITARGGKGIRNYDASKDKVAAVKIVDDIDDVLLSSQEGIIIRLHANEIPVQSRYGSGVRVMRLGENDKVMVLARTDHDDEAQTESIEADTEDEPTAEQLAEMEAADEASAAEAPEADTGDEE